MGLDISVELWFSLVVKPAKKQKFNSPEITDEFTKTGIVTIDTFHQQDGKEDLRPDWNWYFVKSGKSRWDVFGTRESDSCLRVQSMGGVRALQKRHRESWRSDTLGCTAKTARCMFMTYISHEVANHTKPS